MTDEDFADYKAELSALISEKLEKAKAGSPAVIAAEPIKPIEPVKEPDADAAQQTASAAAAKLEELHRVAASLTSAKSGTTPPSGRTAAGVDIQLLAEMRKIWED